jgi:hypothetical protein
MNRADAGFVASLLLVASAGLSCGGNTTGPRDGTASGTVAGQALAVGVGTATFQDGVPANDCGDASPECGAMTTGHSLTIALTNRSDNQCYEVRVAAGAASPIPYAGFQSLTLTILDVGTVQPGHYPLAATFEQPSAASARYWTTTATCGPGVIVDATAGDVTLTSLDPAHVTGTYNLTFGTQGALSGSFDVADCDPASAGPAPPTGCHR